MCNYYASFLPHYAHRSAPLTYLLRKSTLWAWGPLQRDAFEGLCAALCSFPLLCLLDLRAEKEFVIKTDTSDLAVGAVLQQDQGNGLQPVAYLSHRLNAAEQNYPMHEKELLAIVMAMRKWRPYFDGRSTLVVTNHCTLVNFQK